MWTEITRPKYERKGLRYATDVTDAEWALITPHLPAPRALGRPRTTCVREVVNAIFYVLRLTPRRAVRPFSPAAGAGGARGVR